MSDFIRSAPKPKGALPPDLTYRANNIASPTRSAPPSTTPKVVARDPATGNWAGVGEACATAWVGTGVLVAPAGVVGVGVLVAPIVPVAVGVLVVPGGLVGVGVRVAVTWACVTVAVGVRVGVFVAPGGEVTVAVGDTVAVGEGDAVAVGDTVVVGEGQAEVTLRLSNLAFALPSAGRPVDSTIKNIWPSPV